MSIFAKKNLCLLCIAFLYNSQLSSYTNKTYIRPLNTYTYLPEKDRIATFFAQKNESDDLYGRLNISTFYFQSTNENNLGKYFGVNEKNNIVVSARENTQMDLYHNFLIHLRGEGPRVTNINIDPKTIYNGALVSFLYDFSKVIKNLWFKINIPVLQVENDLRMKFAPSGYDANEDAQVIQNYLKGEYQDSRNLGTKQEALKYALIDGKMSKSKFSDIDILLGYKFFDKKTKGSAISAILTIPTGNKPTGKYLFEPIVGNGDHWELGLALDNFWEIFSKKHHSLKITFDAEYKYLFKNTQKRILSIKGANWGQYYLLGKNNSPTNTPLTPAANVLTQDVRVCPGSQIDLDTKLLWSCCNFGINLGYNLFFREEEKVKLKTNFPEQTYAVALDSFDTTKQFPTAGSLNNSINVAFDNYWLSNKSIDLKAAQNPMIFSNTVYGELAYNYTKKDFENIASFNVGTSYTFASQNSSFDGWGVWFRTEFYF